MIPEIDNQFLSFFLLWFCAMLLGCGLNSRCAELRLLRRQIRGKCHCDCHKGNPVPQPETPERDQQPRE